MLREHVRSLVSQVRVFFDIRLSHRVSEAITKAMDNGGGEPRLSRVEKNRRREIVLEEESKPAEKWVEIHFHSGAVIDTKGMAPGLWLEEDPAFTMLERNDDNGVMLGWADFTKSDNSTRVTEESEIPAEIEKVKKAIARVKRKEET